MDQSNRYADLSLKEADLIAGGRHILVAYRMKPKAGHGYLEAAAHFAAESSTGTNVEVSTTDDFTKGLDALVYYIDEATEDMRIAYPMDLFDRKRHRRPHDDGVHPHAGDRQQPGHGRHRVRQDPRHLFPRARDPAVRRTEQGHFGHVARAGSAGEGRRLHRRHHHQAQAGPAARAVLRKRPTSSGWAATSSRTTSPRATRCSRR